MSLNERRENESLKGALSALRESFIATADTLRSQMESDNRISEAIDIIQQLLGENLNAIDILKDSVMIGRTTTP
jgi:hypothetical protein